MGYITLTLQGNHHTMGAQHGYQVRRLRAQIVDAMELRFAQLEQERPDGHFEQLVRETRELLHDIDAPLLDLIRGQAAALSVDFEALLRYDLVTYLRDDLVIRRFQSGPGGVSPSAMPAQADAADRPDPVEEIPGPGFAAGRGGRAMSEGCTTWAAAGSATTGGQPILTKNRDYREEHLPLQAVIQAAPENGFRYLYISSAGSPGVFSAGINHMGLAVADTHVYSRDLGPGLPDYALMMHILEEHDTVSSAVDYLRSVPRLGRNNLILADAQGSMAVFESGNSRYGLVTPADGTLINTNHFVTAEMRDFFVEVDPPESRGRTFHRYETVTLSLSAGHGHIDVPFAQQLMATHNGPLGSICCHPDANSDLSTISASIFLPSQHKMLFCHGLPCQGRYDEFAL